MKRSKYLITFYRFSTPKFHMVCTRTKTSVIKFAIKKAVKTLTIPLIKKL